MVMPLALTAVPTALSAPDNRDGGPTREKLAADHPQVTAVSLASTVSAAELEQLQQTPGSFIAIIRDSILTEVAPDPLLDKTSGLELRCLLDLLTRMEVKEEFLKIRSQEDPEIKWKVVRSKMMREPVA